MTNTDKLNRAAAKAKETQHMQKAIDRSLTAPKVKHYTLPEWQAMIAEDKARYYPHDWYEGATHENS